MLQIDMLHIDILFPTKVFGLRDNGRGYRSKTRKITRECHFKVQKYEGKNTIKLSCFTLWYLFRVHDFNVYIPSIDSWRREEMHVLEWLKWKVTARMYFSSCSRSNWFFILKLWRKMWWLLYLNGCFSRVIINRQ